VDNAWEHRDTNSWFCLVLYFLWGPYCVIKRGCIISQHGKQQDVLSFFEICFGSTGWL
jgi:hypothetical protein